jgi:hypothetical protein
MLKKYTKRKENLKIITIISARKIRDKEVLHRNLEAHQRDKERKDINHSIRKTIQVMIQNPDIRKEGKKGKKEIIMIKDPIKAIGLKKEKVRIKEIIKTKDPIKAIGLKKVKDRIKETKILHPATKVIDISAKQIMQRIEIIKTPIRAPPDS